MLEKQLQPDIVTCNIRAKRSYEDCFFIVLARDKKHVVDKIEELTIMGVSFIIVCGEPFSHPNVIYRKAVGKWDAVNFSTNFVPSSAKVVVFNDVDTKIHNFEYALQEVLSTADLVYCRVKVNVGPQVKFYKILDPIRKKVHICASGELLLIKKYVLKTTLPVPPCMAEDSYILFKALEVGYRAHFCTLTFVTTKRTTNSTEETIYKGRTTLGIYQALVYAKPPFLVRLFYLSLPLFAPLLVLAGKDGKAWITGINSAFKCRLTDNKNPTSF